MTQRLVQLLALTAAACALLASGCASLVNGQIQRVKITSSPPGARVIIDPSAAVVTTPVEVVLFRRHDYKLNFELDGYAPRTATLERTTDPMFYSNALFPPGFWIDGLSPGRWRLPSSVQADLTTIDGVPPATSGGVEVGGFPVQIGAGLSPKMTLEEAIGVCSNIPKHNARLTAMWASYFVDAATQHILDPQIGDPVPEPSWFIRAAGLTRGARNYPVLYCRVSDATGEPAMVYRYPEKNRGGN